MTRLMTMVLALGLALGGCGDDDSGMTGTDAGPGGEDAGGGVDTGPVGEDTGPDFLCDYPAGPYGTATGRHFEPFTLQACDGSYYDFLNEDFCSEEHRLTVISIAAEWCPPCIEESRQFEEQINERYAGQGVRLIQILTQDAEFGEPTLELCNRWVSRFGLTNVEVIDPAQLTSIYFPDGSLPSTIIVDSTGTIRFRENGATSGLISLRAKIEELLAE